MSKFGWFGAKNPQLEYNYHPCLAKYQQIEAITQPKGQLNTSSDTCCRMHTSSTSPTSSTDSWKGVKSKVHVWSVTLEARQGTPNHNRKQWTPLKTMDTVLVKKELLRIVVVSTCWICRFSLLPNSGDLKQTHKGKGHQTTLVHRGNGKQKNSRCWPNKNHSAGRIIKQFIIISCGQINNEPSTSFHHKYDYC